MKKQKMMKLICGVLIFVLMAGGTSDTVSAEELYGGGMVSGIITVDGDVSDWGYVPAIQTGSAVAEGWKVAVSPDASTLYLCMYGTTSNEWDYNFQREILSFTVDGNPVNYQLASLAEVIPGAQLVVTNNANGSVAGDYVVECAMPVSGLPGTNYLLSLVNGNIWANTIPKLDGIIPQPENVPEPVYNGIAIDGDFHDWDAVAKVPAACPSAEHPNCLSATAMVYDGDYVYIYLESGDSSNAFWGGSHSNARFAITTDLGNTLPFTVNSDDTVSGIGGAICRHYSNKAEVAIPKSALPDYLQSLSFGFYLQTPWIGGVVNLVPEEPAGQFNGISYDGVYGDWTYYPHHVIEYATAGTQENVADGEGALYFDGTNLMGHVRTVMYAHQSEHASLFTEAVTFKFGESDSYTFYPRFVAVDGGGNINWSPQIDDLPNGTYEFYMTDISAWGTSGNISALNDADTMYGRMKVTISDVKRECEFYLDLPALADKFGCATHEFRVIKAQFGRIGDEWLVTAGASSGPLVGVMFCLGAVGAVLGIRKRRKGITG